MTKDEALKLALEAFGEIEWSNNSQWQSDRAKVAITAIKEALAQPEQKPWAVARVDDLERAGRVRALAMGLGLDVPLYAAPPQRTWVGLTDEEQKTISDLASANDWHDFDVMDATETKLKEKNA